MEFGLALVMHWQTTCSVGRMSHELTELMQKASVNTVLIALTI